MFSHISTFDFFFISMIFFAGLAFLIVMGNKFIRDTKSEDKMKKLTTRKLTNKPMAVRNK